MEALLSQSVGLLSFSFLLSANGVWHRSYKLANRLNMAVYSSGWLFANQEIEQKIFLISLQ